MMGKADISFIALFVYMLFCHQFDLTKGTRRKIQTNRPIVGIVAQSSCGMSFSPLGKTYIASSYVKFLESSGARVVPIFNNLTEKETKKIFQSINGVVLPGGIVDALTSGYANVSRTMLKLAKKTFDEGGYFPIMGVCLGHQFLGMMEIGNATNVLISTDSNNMTAPLNLPKNYRDYKLFRDISKDFAKAITKRPIASHFHDLALPVQLFQENKKLKHFYKVVTISVDRNGVEFVSTMEAKKYPFYSTQWHPEKSPFEWKRKKAIPHFATSIRLSQHFSNFFVQEARFSKHQFATEKEEKAALIYNYNPTYTAGMDENAVFDQIYLFN